MTKRWLDDKTQKHPFYFSMLFWVGNISYRVTQMLMVVFIFDETPLLTRILEQFKGMRYNHAILFYK
jgi:NADH:ubiquinone oxidoreductase subunit D